MSDFNSTISDDNRFSMSDVGLNTNLKGGTLAQRHWTDREHVVHFPHALIDFGVFG